jgi:hypothetical protein
MKYVAKKIDVLRVYTTCNAIKTSLSAKQVDSVFKAGCGVSDLKPDGTASAILSVPVGVKVSLPFKVRMRGFEFQSFRLLKIAELNTQAVWECYNARVTEAE